MDADAAISNDHRLPPPRSVAHRMMDLWNRLVTYMFQYQDGTCLAALRIAFGFLMLIDTVDERGFCQVDRRWMEPNMCYFPLFDFVRPLPGRWMCVAYASMFAGILGVLTGFHYRTSCVAYAVPYWYILLADKSAWNNHSYLFGLLTLIFSVTDAHHNWSTDKWLQRLPAGATGVVPRWNYLLLRIQFFIMYFVAGLKKLEPDWLSGYSMKSLGYHKVFAPFRYVLPAEFVDWWIVHVTGFLIDLLSGFGLCFQRSRPFTVVVLLAFHTMNSMMFAIGMFPYVCAAMLPVFYDPNSMAEKLSALVTRKKFQPISVQTTKPPSPVKRNMIAAAVCVYAALQMFLPYSHFITQGYNGWRNGLYGYSWDMMVYNVDVVKIQVKVVDHGRREQFFLDPYAWTVNSKWILHGDMIKQFAGCATSNMPDRTNVTIYMDIWASLNGRFYQRLVDPQVDLISAPWSVWSQVDWLMPVVRHLDRWRPWIVFAQDQAEYDLMFFADFPGLKANVYFDGDTNVTLSVIEGVVNVTGVNVVASPAEVQLLSGDAVNVTGEHTVTALGATPSCYVYIKNNAGQVVEDLEPETADRKSARPQCSKACYGFAYELIAHTAKAWFFV
ncbi:vitamin K-dependent gamma-carboxylase [Adelges cooleyi]|uniref:vitamin K-dependent gamma-carboxylase n=1 Tax=Adelges cooleyi TaxID=133065 RepID=UPI00217F5FF5|nr:vitamin K-dependent gamma-carboxylase [Adelges cooleyi]